MQQCEKRMQKGRTRVPATERSEESRGIRPAGGRGASAEPNTRDYLMETERRTLDNETEPEQSRNSELSMPSFHFPVFISQFSKEPAEREKKRALTRRSVSVSTER